MAFLFNLNRSLKNETFAKPLEMIKIIIWL
jgi:hypothetical protein